MQRCLVLMVLTLGLPACATQAYYKDLLALLHDGETTQADVKSLIGNPVTWQNGNIWTYRVATDSEGYYTISEDVHDWLVAHYSLVLEFDPNGVLLHHALVETVKVDQ